MDWDFAKISATGNDFILFDNRDRKLNASTDAQRFRQWCQRRTGIGADGVILLQHSDRADFEYVHSNADGGIAGMCGNGSRAIAFFAHQLGVAGPESCFEINGALYRAQLDGRMVSTSFPPPGPVRLDLKLLLGKEQQRTSGLEIGGAINTGVPHVVLFHKDVDHAPIERTAPRIRHSALFPDGANVNYVQVLDPKHIKMRTWERGVEGETLACGTGAVAAAVICALKKNTASPVRISFRGGDLTVDYVSGFERIKLTGAVTPLYWGRLWR